jgi:hypothetical protein
MAGPTFFFDVPVYRLTEERYYKERDEYINSYMYSDAMDLDFYKRNPDQETLRKDHMQHAYGGCWIYNEIIGYIRLHFLGSQIRGEYFGVKAKRIVRSRRRTMEWQAWKLAPEVGVPLGASNAKIYELIQQYLKDCQRELRGRHIDTEILDTIAPHLDWRRIFLQEAGT